MPLERATYYKVWTARKEGTAGFMVTPSTVLMAGNKQNAVICDDKGVYLGGGGSIAFVTTSENIRQGGAFIQMNDFMRMIPPTIVTIQPQQIPWPPIALPAGIARDLPVFIAMLV